MAVSSSIGLPDFLNLNYSHASKNGIYQAK